MMINAKGTSMLVALAALAGSPAFGQGGQGMVTAGPIVAGVPLMSGFMLAALAVTLAASAWYLLSRRSMEQRTLAGLAAVALFASVVAFALAPVGVTFSGDDCRQPTTKPFDTFWGFSLPLVNDCPVTLQIIKIDPNCQHPMDALVDPCAVGGTVPPTGTCNLPTCGDN